ELEEDRAQPNLLLPRRWGTPVRNQLVALLLTAVAPLAAASAAETETSWSAIQLTGSQIDCSSRFVNARWSLVEKDGVFTAVSEGNVQWRVSTRGLKPDGSGRIDLKDPKGRPAWFEFEPGHGPRKIRYNVANRACVWVLNPV